jgi:hypothetical protein
MYISLYKYTYIYNITYIFIHIYISTYLCIYVSIYLYLCIYIYIFIHIYIYLYIYNPLLCLPNCQHSIQFSKRTTNQQPLAIDSPSPGSSDLFSYASLHSHWCSKDSLALGSPEWWCFHLQCAPCSSGRSSSALELSYSPYNDSDRFS